jgi:hypothetical protein
LVTGSKSTGPPSPFFVRAVRLGPKRDQRVRQVFCLRRLVLDHKPAATIALALGGTGVNGGHDAHGIVRRRQRCARQDGGQQAGCARQCQLSTGVTMVNS